MRVIKSMLVAVSCLLAACSPVGGLGSPTTASYVMIDPSAMWSDFANDMSNGGAVATIEGDAYARQDRGWAAEDEAAVRAEFKAATLGGKLVPAEIVFSDVAGRSDARHVQVSLKIPDGTTVIYGWFGTSVALAGPGVGYGAPQLPQFLESSPGLTFVHTSGSCPRAIAVDFGGTEQERTIQFRFSEDVDLGAATAASVTAHEFNGGDQTDKVVGAKVEQVSKRVIGLRLAALLPGASVTIRLDALVPGLSGFATDYSCAPGATSLSFAADVVNGTGRRWLTEKSMATALAFEHETTVAKHPELSQAK